MRIDSRIDDIDPHAQARCIVAIVTIQTSLTLVDAIEMPRRGSLNPGVSSGLSLRLTGGELRFRSVDVARGDFAPGRTFGRKCIVSSGSEGGSGLKVGRQLEAGKRRQFWLG